MSTPGPNYGNSQYDQQGNPVGSPQYGSAPQYGQYGEAPSSDPAPQYGQYGSAAPNDYSAAYGQPAYGDQGYGQPAAASPYQQGGYVTPTQPTNTLALVSMILSLVGLVTWITAIGGIICGHIARKQISETGEAGNGMALTGIIVGYVIVALGAIGIALYVLLIIFVVSQETSSSYSLLGLLSIVR